MKDSGTKRVDEEDIIIIVKKKKETEINQLKFLLSQVECIKEKRKEN